MTIAIRRDGRHNEGMIRLICILALFASLAVSLAACGSENIKERQKRPTTVVQQGACYKQAMDDLDKGMKLTARMEQNHAF